MSEEKILSNAQRAVMTANREELLTCWLSSVHACLQLSGEVVAQDAAVDFAAGQLSHLRKAKNIKDMFSGNHSIN